MNMVFNHLKKLKHEKKFKNRLHDIILRDFDSGAARFVSNG